MTDLELRRQIFDQSKEVAAYIEERERPLVALSPLAQEVVRVYNLESRHLGDRLSPPRYMVVAEVLRAIANHYHQEDEMRRYMPLQNLLSIADELEAFSRGEFND